MTNWILQITAVARVKFASIAARAWLASVTVLALALVAVVLLALLSMREGFVRTLRETGAPDVAVVLRTGAQSEINSVINLEQARLVESAPGVALGEDGRPLTSPELYMIVSAIRKDTGKAANIALRGMEPKGATIRSSMHVSQGRMFVPGQQEIVVGKAIADAYQGYALGRSVRLGNTDWTVAGIFEAGGALDNEIWADRGVVQSVFKRPHSVQTIRVKLTDSKELPRVAAFLSGDPRLQLEVQSERAFYASQASQTSDLIQKLGWPMGLVMAIGALVSALSTMQASIDAHASEIVTLRTIGFGSLATFVGNMAEALCLGVLGAVLGVLFAYLAFDGLSASTLSSELTQVSFHFDISRQIATQAFALALAAGFLGGLLPSWRTSRGPLVGRPES